VFALQTFQHPGGSGVVAAFGFAQPLCGQRQLLKQNIRKLLRRVDVERLAGQRMNFCL
jgi:hypothetical protein